MSEKKTRVKLEFDLENNLVIGSSDATTDSDEDISRKIIKSLSRKFSDISSAWIKDFEEKVSNGELTEAYDIFETNQSFFQFTKSTDILITLLKLDVTKLEKKEQRKEYLSFRVAYSAHIGKRHLTKNDLDSLLDEFLDDLDPVFIQNLFLEKANVAAQENLRNKASILYKRVIEFPDADPGTIAWAYQGLSLISDNEKDRIFFTEKAADKHLESGNRLQAITNLLTLSESLENSSPERSLEFIDRCIDLYDSEKLLDRELIGSLNYRKAHYLHRIGQPQESMKYAIQSIEMRKGLIGNERGLHANFSLASIIAEELGDHETAENYKKEAQYISSLIDDLGFDLRMRLSDAMASKGAINEELFSEIISSQDESVLSAALLYQSCTADLSTEEALESLDRARLILEKDKDGDKRLLEIVYFAIAERYRKEGMIPEALASYKMSLSYNKFSSPAAQNCLAMLFDANLWVEAESLLRDRIELVGELPNICFAYGKALCENGKYALALKYLSKSDADIKQREEYISKCLNNLSDHELTNHTNHNIIKEKPVSADIFYTALEEFSASISSDSRMHFWYQDKESKDYKWVSKPEELAKQMLITFLNGKFGKGAIEILQEPRAGAGFIDLYAILPGGLRVVVELKMCGGGYTSTYAISGEGQIIHYQNNRNTNLGYLVVLDGRMRDFGMGFKKLQTIDTHTIYSIAVDMRPKIDKKKSS
jgi:tetratricopeptide (TPR) repeat protein